MYTSCNFLHSSYQLAICDGYTYMHNNSHVVCVVIIILCVGVLFSHILLCIAHKPHACAYADLQAQSRCIMRVLPLGNQLYKKAYHEFSEQVQ